MDFGKMSMLCSDISHMALLSVLRDSGVTQKHGFDLDVDVATIPPKSGRPVRSMKERATSLLAGEYEFLSGLHHETYIYRAKGDKRFVYLGQAQNDWDDRLIARPEIRDAKQLEGKKILTNRAPCVGGNLDHSLELAGVDTSKIEHIYGANVGMADRGHNAIEMLVRGEIDAANVDIPFDLQGKKKGFNAIKLPSVPVIHNTTICASTDFTLNNEDKVYAFLKAFIEAVHFFKTEKQKVCEILSRELAPMIQATADDEVEYLHQQWSDLLSVKPYPHPVAIWNVYNLDVAHDPKVNFIGPLEPWNTHYLREIDDSGFIDRLYGNAAKN